MNDIITFDQASRAWARHGSQYSCITSHYYMAFCDSYSDDMNKMIFHDITINKFRYPLPTYSKAYIAECFAIHNAIPGANLWIFSAPYVADAVAYALTHPTIF